MKLISKNNGLQCVNLPLYGKKLLLFGNGAKDFMLKIILTLNGDDRSSSLRHYILVINFK
jgi:hypothetical protein